MDFQALYKLLLATVDEYGFISLVNVAFNRKVIFVFILLLLAVYLDFV